MNSVEIAILNDGRSVKFVLTNDPPSGGMKKTFFTPDRAQVVQFYHDQTAVHDPAFLACGCAVCRLARLDAILGKNNITIEPNSTTKSAQYWKRLFCWPTGIVTKPLLGLIAPTYPSNFFFATGPFKGNEKKGKYFSSPKLRKYLPAAEQGTWLNYFQICILIARAVRRLHMAGLAHSDLSSSNILIDPSTGKCIVIDIDSLVVPGKLPPDVSGTPGYIAPEVLSTMSLDLKDPKRKFPSILTDLHALAVLIYEYLMFRHPLQGPKIHAPDALRDDFLSMGSEALFVEHPTDHSNRPKDLKVPCSALGPELHNLFRRAFVDGLHTPNLRPTAIEWERALIRTWDLFFPCINQHCSHRWLILWDEKNVRCPFCGQTSRGTIPTLNLLKEGPRGQWKSDGRLTVYPDIHLFKWHAFDNVFPGEEADRVPVARCVYEHGMWKLENKSLSSLTSPGGSRVPIGQGVQLKEGVQFRLSQEPHGRMAEVQMIDLQP
jgi:hypothetical protein